MRIERLGPDDDDRVAAAEALFDDAIDAGTTRAFLADDGHHLLIAVDDGSPAGFVTGVELLHPDKPGPEMFLYELGVDEAFRGRGIGRALVEALTAIAWERGCYGCGCSPTRTTRPRWRRTGRPAAAASPSR